MPVPTIGAKEKLNKTSREIVYEGLNKWIMDGTLQPGEKLADAEIADYFAVSRTPVREALQMLANQQLVVIESGKGSYVAPLDQETVRQAYYMLAELHVTAVNLMFDRVDESVITKMKEKNALYAKACKSSDPLMLTKCDTDFHNVYMDLTDNQFLKQFNEELTIHASRFRNLHFHQFHPTPDGHNDIIKAFEERDLDGAIRLVRHNWIGSFGEFAKIVWG